MSPGKVTSLEIIPELAKKARDNFAEFRENNPKTGKKLNIDFIAANVLKSLDSWKESYDKIIITAGIESSQEELIIKLAKRLLEDGGRLVCPRRHGPLLLLDKKKGNIIQNHTSEEYVFVPLISE